MAKTLAALPRPGAAPGDPQISLFSTQETPDAFRKAVQVLHSKPKSPLSLLQRKLGNAWLKHAIENQPDPDGWWELSIKDLAQNIGFDSHNRQYLKESAEALMSIVFEWDVIAPSNKRIHWKASVLFPEIEIRSDVIRYQLSSQMRERMINPDIYAMIDMNVVRRFRRAPSLAIWEFCIRFEKIGRTAEVDWGQFRDMVLGEASDGSTYQEYKYFKSKVLNPAIAEINSESNHVISLLETRMGKRVAALRFEVAKKPGGPVALPEPETGDLVTAMIGLGVPASEARKLAQQHEPAAVRAALDYTRRRMDDAKLSPLDKPAAYFRQALSHGYAQVAAGPSPAKASAPAQVRKAARQGLDLRQAYEQAQLREGERYFKELDATEQASLAERYNAWQEVPALKLRKRVTKVAQAAFTRWLVRETWGEPSSEDLLQFAEQVLSAGGVESHEWSPHT